MLSFNSTSFLNAIRIIFVGIIAGTITVTGNYVGLKIVFVYASVTKIKLADIDSYMPQRMFIK